MLKIDFINSNKITYKYLYKKLLFYLTQWSWDFFSLYKNVHLVLPFSNIFAAHCLLIEVCNQLKSWIYFVSFQIPLSGNTRLLGGNCIWSIQILQLHKDCSRPLNWDIIISALISSLVAHKLFEVFVPKDPMILKVSFRVSNGRWQKESNSNRVVSWRLSYKYKLFLFGQ